MVNRKALTMQFENSYKYAIGLMNPDYDLTSEVDGNIITWTLKENGAHIIQVAENINCVCEALNKIVIYLKNPAHFEIKTTVERDAIADPENGQDVYNSDDKAINTWCIGVGAWL